MLHLVNFNDAFQLVSRFGGQLLSDDNNIPAWFGSHIAQSEVVQGSYMGPECQIKATIGASVAPVTLAETYKK